MNQILFFLLALKYVHSWSSVPLFTNIPAYDRSFLQFHRQTCFFRRRNSFVLISCTDNSIDELSQKQKMFSSLPLMRVVDLRHALGQFGITPSPKLRKAELTEMLKRALQYEPLLLSSTGVETRSSPIEPEPDDVVASIPNPELERGSEPDPKPQSQDRNIAPSSISGSSSSTGSRCRSFLSSIEEDDYSDEQPASHESRDRQEPLPSFGARMRSWSLETDIPVTEWSGSELVSAAPADDWDLAALKAELRQFAQPQAGPQTDTGPGAPGAANGPVTRKNVEPPTQPPPPLPRRSSLATTDAASQGGLGQPAPAPPRRRTVPERPQWRPGWIAAADPEGLGGTAARRAARRPTAPEPFAARGAAGSVRLPPGVSQDIDGEEDQDKDKEEEEEEDDVGEGEAMSEEALEAAVAQTDPSSLLGGVLRALLPAALHDLRPRPPPPPQRDRYLTPGRPAGAARRADWRTRGRRWGGRGDVGWGGRGGGP
jgi:hypothetical protein